MTIRGRLVRTCASAHAYEGTPQTYSTPSRAPENSRFCCSKRGSMRNPPYFHSGIGSGYERRLTDGSRNWQTHRPGCGAHDLDSADASIFAAK
jgi:hypothetical protein